MYTSVLETYDPNGELFKKISDAGNDYQQVCFEFRCLNNTSLLISLVGFAYCNVETGTSSVVQEFEQRSIKVSNSQGRISL
jgi:hypothetical protein